MLPDRAYLERFGDMEKTIAKKMVRQFRTYDGARGLLQIEAETLAYIALEYLEEHGLLQQIDGTQFDGTQFDGTQFDGLAEPFTVEGKSKLPQTPTERIDGAE